MKQPSQSRRDFLKTTTASLAAGSMPYWFASQSARAFNLDSPNERHVIGCIGTGSRWGQIVGQAALHGDIVAVCDADSEHAGKGRDRVNDIQSKKGASNEVEIHEDYRKILDRDDIDVVTIVTPDHWHSKIAIEAMRAGKDVYCEKPLTLTIDEGKKIAKVLEETGRVFQVGTQQRSEYDQRFLTAVAMVQDGRIGEVKKVHCIIGGAPTSGPLETESVPSNLNWDMWLGQAPETDYIPRRCHYEFRWWYEYSGGKMTDWGAHHVDIAQWAIGMDHTGPQSVEGTAVHPVPFEDGYPTVHNEYNTATSFRINCQFPNGVELVIMDNDVENNIGNGILFMGDKGRFLVDRGKMAGRPVEELETNPLPEDALVKIYKGKQPGSHMGNFFECIKTREQPISDVYTHHRAMTTCHLANIAIRLGRKLEWDAEAQQIVGDPEAQKWQAREQRKGYEIHA